MIAKKHIFIIDDDRDICTLLDKFLSKHNYKISTAYSSESFLEQFTQELAIDLILLDIMLPGMDGIELCRLIRETSQVPLIMLTAVTETTDKIVSLELGADDYLSKPFDPRELLARIKALIRRTKFSEANTIAHQHNSSAATIFKFADWTLDTASRRLLNPHDMEIALSAGCYALLVSFAEHPQRVLNRDQLLTYTKNRLSEPFDRSIDVQISRLRQKLELDPKNPQFIKTVRSGGYIFTPNVSRF